MAFHEPLAVGMTASSGTARPFGPAIAARPQRLAWPAAALTIGTLCVGLWLGLGWAAATLL
jgi:hypothetical protein